MLAALALAATPATLAVTVLAAATRTVTLALLGTRPGRDMIDVVAINLHGLDLRTPLIAGFWAVCMLRLRAGLRRRMRRRTRMRRTLSLRMPTATITAVALLTAAGTVGMT